MEILGLAVTKPIIIDSDKSVLSSGYTHTVQLQVTLFDTRCMAAQREYEASMGRLSLGAALKGS